MRNEVFSTRERKRTGINGPQWDRVQQRKVETNLFNIFILKEVKRESFLEFAFW
jgi:hypothetical protein